MKTKSIFKLAAVISIALIISACGQEQSDLSQQSSTESTENTTGETQTDNLIVQEINKALAERGVTFGMSEEDVLNAETVEFEVDKSPYSTYIDDVMSVKTIVSTSAVKYKDYDAILSYKFINNELDQMNYDIPINYYGSDVLATPAYAVFLDYQMPLAEILGNPAVPDFGTANDRVDVYNNVWSNGDDTGMIMLSCNQSKLTSYSNEDTHYTDNISITFFSGE